MNAFLIASFANRIHIIMTNCFTFLRIHIPVCGITDDRINLNHVNKILCLSGLFHNSNADFAGVDFLDRLFLLLMNCLDPIFGLGFLGLLPGAAQILDAEDDLHNDRFGAHAVFIGVG